MTEASPDRGTDWKTALDLAVSAAGHESRNALNGLVVNLEVVRAMAQRAGYDAEPFMSKAVEQSEESIRLSEAAIALLRLVVAAVGPSGEMHVGTAGPREVSLNGGADAKRLSDALQPLADRGAIAVERSGSTVILRIPEERHE